jgi:hypothetical protein
MLFSGVKRGLFFLAFLVQRGLSESFLGSEIIEAGWEYDHQDNKKDLTCILKVIIFASMATIATGMVLTIAVLLSHATRHIRST